VLKESRYLSVDIFITVEAREGVQSHPLAKIFWANFWLDLGKIKAKLKVIRFILHPQKHSISYGYAYSITDMTFFTG